jgi:hypothetical protein
MCHHSVFQEIRRSENKRDRQAEISARKAMFIYLSRYVMDMCHGKFEVNSRNASLPSDFPMFYLPDMQRTLRTCSECGITSATPFR